ncbi:MAG: hypothetical protein KDD02_26545 [Phaeodactylibacter sp.]|nr:hypothetical protein [Phaeodactylibacter sp.]MCB9304761.1 hypothetical protein [Lewinellaceae bacterium]
MADAKQMQTDGQEERTGASEETILERVRLEWKHYIYEFFIVALGISVPFLLDRYNQSLQERQIEQQYYANLRQELAEDLEDLQGNRDYNAHYLSMYEYGSLIILENERNLADTLGRIVYNIRYYSDFHRNSNLYETLVQSGELPLIQNQEVLGRLQNLEEAYTYLNRMEGDHFKVIMDLAAPNLVDRLQIRPFKVMDEEWLFGYKCHNLLLIFISLCEEKEDIYASAERQILELQDILLKELE